MRERPLFTRRRANRTVAAGLVSILIDAGCQGQVQPAVGAEPFKLVVVGEGIVRKSSARGRSYSLNEDQALAMLKGIQLAEQRLRLGPLGRIFSIEVRDDLGKVAEAPEIARKILRDPSVLAVIGHSSSGTTAVAASIYAQGNIPLLMPIATSPNTRGRTAFRMPLDDRTGQAPAIAHVLRNLVRNPGDARPVTRVVVVFDVSEDAQAYSVPLKDSLKGLLDFGEFQSERSVDVADPLPAARHCIDYRPDVVVFVGYSVTANRFLAALRKVYADYPRPEAGKSVNGGSDHRPVIVLTDGALRHDLNTSDFHVYLTAPFPPLTSGCEGDDAEILRKALGNDGYPNYVLLGYDSLILFAEALKRCRDQGAVSRSCIASSLGRSGVIRGVCSDYSFTSRENSDGRYFVYRAVAVGKPERLQLSLEKELSLRQLEALSEGRPSS